MAIQTYVTKRITAAQESLIQQCISKAKNALTTSEDYNAMNARREEILAELHYADRALLEVLEESEAIHIFAGGALTERASV